MKSSKPIIGICGGIGSGKSRVAEEFSGLGCRVSDSDADNRALLETKEVQETLRGWWGDDVIGPDGRTNRSRVAAVVFGAAAAKKKLEGLLHPLIAARRETMIAECNQDGMVKAIILDSPLLFESGLDRQCDHIVFVDTDEAVRLRRLQKQRNWDASELRRREQWQESSEHKRLHSDFVVVNNGACEALRPQVARILEEIVSEPTSE